MDIPQNIADTIEIQSNLMYPDKELESIFFDNSSGYRLAYQRGAQMAYKLAMAEIEELKATKTQLQSGINVMGERCEELQAEVNSLNYDLFHVNAALTAYNFTDKKIEELKAENERLKREIKLLHND